MNLSVVMAGRNDTYGGDFVGRLNRSLESIVPLGCEIIVVEWNPPQDKEPLAKVIRHKGVRVITVGADVHNSLHGAELFPMFEYRAKNVGIRRAKSEWTLVLNSDIILTEEMRGKLGGGGFLCNLMYGARRRDMDGDILIQICEGPGDFVLMPTPHWHALRGYLDIVSYTHIDSLLWWTAEKYGMHKCILKEHVIHQEHDRSEHSVRWGIHSSDIRRFISQGNHDNWGLAGLELPEVMT